MEHTRAYTVRAIAIVIIVSFAFLLALLAREYTFFQEMVASYGYLGILAVSFASGFNLIVPIPAVSFVPLYSEAGLSIPITLALITIGMTAADSIAYLLGRLSRTASVEIERSRIVRFLDRIKVKHKNALIVIIFFYAVLVPLPNEVLAVPLGLMHFRFTLLIPLLLAGNAAFNIITAYGILAIFEVVT